MATRRSGRHRRSRLGGAARRVLDVVLAAAILGLLGLLALRIEPIESHSLSGVPVVNDGDSITLLGRRLRLRGIDAPELSQQCFRDDREYACGRAARDELRKLIGEGRVACEGWELDRYERLLVRCHAGQTDLNHAMVLSGWALAYGHYGDAERSAQEAGRGLWAGTFERPSRWRTTHGGMAESEHGLLRTLSNWLRQILRMS